MSIGAGALAVRRLQVMQKPFTFQFSEIVEMLQGNVISPIGVDEIKEQSMGWCHPFTGEPDLSDAQQLVYGQSFVFGMRADSKKIPGTLFRLQMRAALDVLTKGNTGDDGDARKKRMSKKLKDAAKDRIKEELLKRSLPHIRLVEIVWHLDSNEIWLTSGSASVVGEFEKLFTETFGLPLVHKNPGTLAVDFDRVNQGLDSTAKASLQKLYDLVPANLFGKAQKPLPGSGPTASPSSSSNSSSKSSSKSSSGKGRTSSGAGTDLF